MKKSIYTPLRYAQLMDASTLPDIGFTGIIRRLISESDDVMKFLWYDTNFMNQIIQDHYDILMSIFSNIVPNYIRYLLGMRLFQRVRIEIEILQPIYFRHIIL